MQKLIKSFDYAIDGIIFAIKHERNFRVHMIAFGVVALFGLMFRISNVEWALILICVGVVHSMEMINSAIERTWDHLEPEHHPVVKTVKDLMAGAVLFFSIISLVIATLIFFPKIF